MAFQTKRDVQKAAFCHIMKGNECWGQQAPKKALILSLCLRNRLKFYSEFVENLVRRHKKPILLKGELRRKMNL